MGIFSFTHRLDNPDVNMHMKLRTSAMFALLQQAASQHCLELGTGPDRTVDRGFLWVVTRQKAEIISMPRYEDTIRIETWPGPTKHVIFPRYSRILDMDGNVLIKASAVWTLIDARTRSIAHHSQHGIALEGVVTGDELSLPRAPEQIELSREHSFVVPYSYVDINKHMNNTRYFDLAEDIIESPVKGDTLKSVSVEYSNEVKLGEEIRLGIGQEGKKYYVCGDTDKHIFKLFLDYGGDN